MCEHCGRYNWASIGDTCPYCGGEHHEHQWQAASCFAPETCVLCGAMRGEKLPAGVGDVVEFGKYEQDNNWSNDKEAIEWIVIGTGDDGSLVLLSKYALDHKPYNRDSSVVTWETCTLRARLNNDFYYTAFRAEEQGKIKTAKLENENSPVRGTAGGRATEDKIWLLSINEMCDDFTGDKVFSYFSNDVSRMCAPTEYAVAQGAYQDSEYTVDGVGACWWWLRSPGDFSNFAAGVSLGGFVDDGGSPVSYVNRGARPVVVVLP